MWLSGESHPLWVGVKIGSISLENGLALPNKGWTCCTHDDLAIPILNLLFRDTRTRGRLGNNCSRKRLYFPCCVADASRQPSRVVSLWANSEVGGRYSCGGAQGLPLRCWQFGGRVSTWLSMLFFFKLPIFACMSYNKNAMRTYLHISHLCV